MKEFDFKSYAEEFVKRQEKFLFERLSGINNEYVGFKIQLSLPTTDASKWNELTFKGEYHYSFIGVNNKEDLDRYLKEGYNICKKESLEKFRSL
ncbi:hypothetical protein CLPUN_05040 [Clostridium puniceum]|uniref:Uncharacterized protein n=1 Tax=Clostridium puniceum TaxID=29367 RepID=A0A1S8TXI3_9CLOT|nr:hypothetical protein [Clostridium puniceum]OOM82125.1 hypothetical protein CLPUN_05040 [Clostridium puniceum]